MATAAGVAGGMLAANAISSWLSSSPSSPSTASTSTTQPTQDADATGATRASQSGEAQGGPGHHEATHESDDGGWFGGDGGDFEI
jgi:hypothetical protein